MRGYIVRKLVQRLQCVGFALDVFWTFVLQRGEFCKEASESNFGIHSWGVMPRRYEEQLQKRGRHRYRRNGIFEGFWLFLLYEGYQNNLSMMVIVSGGHWAMLLCQPWSDKWCPKSKENAVFGPILTITSCLNVLNSTEKDEREDDIMDRDLL